MKNKVYITSNAEGECLEMQNQQDSKCDAGEKKCGKKQDWLWGCEEGQEVNCGGVGQDTRLLELL